MCKNEMDPASIVEDTERTQFCPPWKSNWHIVLTPVYIPGGWLVDQSMLLLFVWCPGLRVYVSNISQLLVIGVRTGTRTSSVWILHSIYILQWGYGLWAFPENILWNSSLEIHVQFRKMSIVRDILSDYVSKHPGCSLRKRWRATACCGKSKFAISSGWLKKGSVSHPDDIITLP